MKGIITGFLQLFSAIGLMLGIAYFVSAITTPGNYPLYNASAVQISQVYSEASYYAVLSVSCFLFGIFIQLALYFGGYLVQSQVEDITGDIASETIAIRQMLKKIGSLLQQQVNGQSGVGRAPVTEKSGMRTLLNRDEPEF